MGTRAFSWVVFGRKTRASRQAATFSSLVHGYTSLGRFNGVTPPGRSRTHMASTTIHILGSALTSLRYLAPATLHSHTRRSGRLACSVHALFPPSVGRSSFNPNVPTCWYGNFRLSRSDSDSPLSVLSIFCLAMACMSRPSASASGLIVREEGYASSQRSIVPEK